MSPEVQFDPSTGSSNFVSRGAQVDPPSSYEEREANTHQIMAQGLADRAANRNQSTAGETTNLATEQKLLDLQSELSRETNPIKIEQLQAQCVALAAGLVGDEVPQSEPDGPVDEDFDQEMINNNPGVIADLQNAAEVLDADLAAGYNDHILGHKDPVVKSNGYALLSDLRQNPEMFGSRSEMTALTPAHESSLAELVGEELASDIMTCNAAIMAGKPPTAVMATVMKSPKHMKAFRAAAEAGIITIAL